MSPLPFVYVCVHVWPDITKFRLDDLDRNGGKMGELEWTERHSIPEW